MHVYIYIYMCVYTCTVLCILQYLHSLLVQRPVDGASWTFLFRLRKSQAKRYSYSPGTTQARADSWLVASIMAYLAFTNWLFQEALQGQPHHAKVRPAVGRMQANPCTELHGSKLWHGHKPRVWTQTHRFILNSLWERVVAFSMFFPMFLMSVGSSISCQTDALIVKAGAL